MRGNGSLERRNNVWETTGKWQNKPIPSLSGCKAWVLSKKHHVRNRATDVENKLMVAGDMEGGINWEVGIDMYTLLYIKWITNKNLLCSIGNSSLMAYMWKESKKRVDTLCITDSLCCTPETNTSL